MVGRWRGVGMAFAGVLSAIACGHTDRNADEQPMAGRGGGTTTVATAGRAGQPHASGSGGSGTSSGGQPAGDAGSFPIAGAPARHPLIVGDDACPLVAPTGAACTQSGSSCVYRGISSGLSSTDEPVHCVCEAGSWACAQSDEKGETSCPFVVGVPGANDPCPPSGESCVYALLAQNALAVCSCREGGGAGAGGAAGAAGAEAGPNSIWTCGL